MMFEVLEVELDAMARMPIDDLAKLLGESIHAVSRETHDLVFFAETVEPGELAESRIVDAKRLGPERPGQNADLISFALCNHIGGKIPGSIDADARGPLEGRPIVRARNVSDVMLDVVER